MRDDSEFAIISTCAPPGELALAASHSIGGDSCFEERHAEFRITSARRRRLPTCMHAFRYRCPCAIRRFSRRCRFAHGCSARCALNHSGGSASKLCLMTILTFRSPRWVSLTTGGNTPSGSSCLLNVGVCGHHNLHADADAALRTASNRLSGVTTRHISSTVRIFRSEEVKADGHCGSQL